MFTRRKVMEKNTYTNPELSAYVHIKFYLP